MDHKLRGSVLAIISAVGYSAANVTLRELSESVEHVFVCCIKAVPTVLVAGSLVVLRRACGKPVGLSRYPLLVLIGTSLLAQFGGNVGLQLAFENIGLAPSVPLTLGMMMVSGALLGRIILGEGVSMRAVVSMIVVAISVVIIKYSVGPDSASPTEVTSGSVWQGVLYACFAGFSFASLGVAIRRFVGRVVPLPSALLVVSLTGFVSLAIASIPSGGWQQAPTIPADTWRLMVLSGVFNMMAFFALSGALRATTIVHVNVVNASQAAIAVLAAVLLFHEEMTGQLVVGVLLTLVGILLMRDRRTTPVGD